MNPIQTLLNVDEILGKDFMSRFKVYQASSLFEPDLNLLKEKRCPVCTRRLYANRAGTIWRCKSKMANDKFFIRNEILTKFLK